MASGASPDVPEGVAGSARPQLAAAGRLEGRVQGEGLHGPQVREEAVVRRSDRRDVRRGEAAERDPGEEGGAVAAAANARRTHS